MSPVQGFQETAGDCVSGVDLVVLQVVPNVSLLRRERIGLVEAMPPGVAGEAAEPSDYGVGSLVRDRCADTHVQLDEVHLVSFVDAELGKVKAIGQFWTKAVS